MRHQGTFFCLGVVVLLSGCVKGTYEDYRYAPGVYGPTSFSSFPYLPEDEYLYRGGSISFTLPPK